MDHIFSELSSMTHPSWVALHSMAHSFIELDKAVVHVIRLVSSVIVVFSLSAFHKRLMEDSWWERPTAGKLGLVLMGRAMLSQSVSSVTQSCPTLWPHESQHARPPCPSPTPGVYTNSCPSSWWCHPAISSSVVPFSSCPQSLPTSGSFPMSQLFAWGGQRIGVSASASVLPMNTGLISFRMDWLHSLQSKWLSRVFSNTTVQKHQFFGTQLSSQSNSHIHTWPLKNHSLDQMDLSWQSNVSAF